MGREGDVVAPPGDLEGLTASWLTSALRVAHPGVEVTSLTVANVRQGSNTTARLLVGYDREGHRAGLPATLYVKGAWTGRSVGGTFNEARFYQEVAPLLPGLNIPKCLFASADDD